MRAFVVSDSEQTRGALREMLLRSGYDCPTFNAVSVLSAASRINQAVTEAEPDLVVFGLSPDLEAGLATLTEVRRVSRARILAVGPAGEAKFILRALRSGADDYIDESDVDAELAGALDNLRVDAGSQSQPGALISVLAPSGGSGSSTIAVNVATELARVHKTCGLFDLKLGGGDLTALLDLKTSHTIDVLCQNFNRLDMSMFEQSLARHSSGVHLLAAPASVANIMHVTAKGVDRALALARSRFPFVVADLDDCFHAEQAGTIGQSELVLLVLRLDFSSLRNARRTLDHLDYLGVSRERVKLVVNRYGQPKEVPYSQAEEALEMKIFHYIPDDPKTINRANNQGVPAVIDAPSAKVSRSLCELATKIESHCKAAVGAAA